MTDAEIAQYAWSMIGWNWSDDSYYVAPRGNGIPVTVVAETKKAAIHEADRVLGGAGRGRHWQFTNIKAKDLRLLTDAEKEKL